MSVEPIRGRGLGFRSWVNETDIELEPRSLITYLCAHCETTLSVPLALEADIPDTWVCRRCGSDALREGLSREHVQSDERSGKTPFEMLLERRTREELEVILYERLEYLRARRGIDFEKTSV